MTDAEDAPLLNEADDDDRLITSEDRPPTVEAVFVVTFDVHYGNKIEFQWPNDEQLSLNGIEYKAIPSASHRINHDFTYFRHRNKYGLACVIREDINSNDDDGRALSLTNDPDRGMRIKSVGILTSSIIHIQSYLDALKFEAQNYLHHSSIDYDRLKNLSIQPDQSITVLSSIYDNLFVDFIQHFGASIFPLARLILLGKRILLYSDPPIGPICNAVYFIHMLNQSVNPLFFISILDINLLGHEVSYIACTTEQIYQEKPSFYDVFINCNRKIVFQTNDLILKSIIKITRNDRQRFKKRMTLNTYINIGNRLLRSLDRLSKSNTNYQLTKEDFHSLDFHHHYDRLFMNEYIQAHRIPYVTISNPNSILSPFSCCQCSTYN